MDAVGVGGTGDLEQWHLRAERNALGAFQRKNCFNHQQTEDVMFIRDASEQNARTALAAGQGGNGLAEQAFGQFGEQMFLENLNAAIFPGRANLLGERGNCVLDKILQPLTSQALLHGLLVAQRVMLFDQAK